MWERDEDRLALLELLEAGHLRRRTGQDEAWTLLDELPWTRRTGRRDEIELVPEHKATLVELLDRVWRGWSWAVRSLPVGGWPRRRPIGVASRTCFAQKRWRSCPTGSTAARRHPPSRRTRSRA